MIPGDLVTVPIRGDGWHYTIVELLPAGQVTLTREIMPWERVWGNYERPHDTANRRGIKRVFLMVNSASDLRAADAGKR